MKQPDILEQYLHDITVLSDAEIEAKYYTSGLAIPRYSMPAIPETHQWDYSLGILLLTIPPLTEEEWDREEELWVEWCESLDRLEETNLSNAKR